MRWFKHMSTASRDEALTYLMQEMGCEAYAIYFIILETIASRVEADNPKLSLHEEIWARNAHSSSEKIRRFIELDEEFFQNRLLNFQEQQNKGETGKVPCRLLECSFNGKILTIEAAKLLKYRDEYSGKKGGMRKNQHKTPPPPDKLPTMSGYSPPPDTDTDTEVDTDTENKKTYAQNSDKPNLSDSVPASPSSRGKKNKALEDEQAERIYQIYPRKRGKSDGIKAIKKALKKVDFNTLYTACEEYANSPLVKQTEEQYIPYPATWFNKGRWEERSEWNGSSAFNPRGNQQPQSVSEILDSMMRDPTDEELAIAEGISLDELMVRRKGKSFNEPA